MIPLPVCRPKEGAGYCQITSTATFLARVRLAILVLWIASTTFLVKAQEVSKTGAGIEPIEFVATATTQMSSTALPSGTSASWGFAIFSLDSKFIATIAQPESDVPSTEILVWNVADLKVVCRVAHPGRIMAAVFSPDSSLLAIGPNGPHFGIRLIDVKTGSVHQTLPGPASKSNCLAFSGDGARLAVGSSLDKTVRVWDIAKKRFIKAYELDLTHVHSVAFAADGKILAVGSPQREKLVLNVIDVAAGKVIQTLTGHKEMIDSAEFSHDATRIVSAGWDAMVRVWSVTTGESIAELKGHKRGVSAVSQSADGKRIASANNREFKLWDGEKKEVLADLGGENSNARLLAMSPDAAWLISIARDGAAHLWDVEKLSERTTFGSSSKSSTAAASEKTDDPNGAEPPPSTDLPEPEAIQALAYSRDGKWLAIACDDGRVSIRRAGDGIVHREIAAFSDVASSVAFSPDSRLLAAGSFEKVIRIWNVEKGDVVAELTGHTNWIFGIAFSNDGQTLASASYDKTIKLWNIAAASEIATLSGHTAGVRAVAYTRDGKYLISGGSDRTAMVWDLETRMPVATLKGHTAAIRDILCSPDGGTIATASEDATIKLWKTQDWTERAVARGAEGVMFWCLAFSPQGRTLAAGAFDGTIKLFDPSDGKERATLRGPTDAVTSVAFAPDAHEIVAGSIDKSFRRWTARKASVTTGETKAPELKSAEAATALNAVTLKIEQPVLSLAFDKPGKLLAVGTGAYRGPGGVQLWDVIKHERKWQTPDFKFGVPGIAFSQTGQQLAVGNFADNFLRLYNVADGSRLKELRGHRSKVHGIAYSPNGKYFATASLDNDIKLWDATTNREVKAFVGHKDYAFSIEFSGDGKLLLSGSADRTARLWNVESGQKVHELTGHLGLIQQATFSRDGQRVATASADGTGRVYDVDSGDYLFTLRGHRSKIETVAFSPNGKLIATGSSDRTVRLWDATCGFELLKLTQEAAVRAVQFSPDGQHLATGCDDKTVTFWDMTSY